MTTVIVDPAGTDDHLAIAAAIASVGAGGTAQLGAGTFDIAADVSVSPGVNLIGTTGTVLDAPGAAAVQVIAEGANRIASLELTGGIMLTARGDDVYVAGCTSRQKVYNPAAFCVCLTTAPDYLVQNVTFADCHAIGTSGHGFFIDGYYGRPPYPHLMRGRNITFTGCTATNCGQSEDCELSALWITGFDLAEGGYQVTLENCRVENCTATGCWESGFHNEAAPHYIDCHFVNCTSDNNARKASPMFGAGFQTAHGWTLTNCTTYGNKYGIKTGTGAGNPHPGKQLVIRDCQVISPTWRGLYVNAVPEAPFHDLIVDNLTIADVPSLHMAGRLDAYVTSPRITGLRLIDVAGTITYGATCTDVEITYYVPPFGIEPAVIAPGISVRFTDASTHTHSAIPPHPAKGWAWSFGDGTTSDAQNPVHAYTAPGEYTVTLTAGGNTVVETVHVQYPINPHSRVMRQRIGWANKYPRVI